ncbi:hypothetical protein IFR23_05310 [Sphingomonas sp. CFBP 13603]|uniref:hypothetical protein n=1 Tax=Sphingomonas sp. CFBP 13603 TaxID=2774040 RepID=UPI001867D31C|nr:hypothetical protein [Sphingomonas sp. CFBP 13603]MBE2991431.1 hypothetical protein [Sphingomonas sp. CFBP 13603]
MIVEYHARAFVSSWNGLRYRRRAVELAAAVMFADPDDVEQDRYPVGVSLAADYE